ncbi:MAG: hypothetical protein GF334_01340 [Candidatus Altiarchaeales archaeon]|nr:hypothetical protein [Candidatus Altiarchaeales archaeon]
MFEHLKKHSQIVVTGPQRAGTTICAKMIAHDLGYPFWPEERCGEDLAPYCLIREHLKEGQKAVYQLPAFSAWCHLLPKPVAVVFMLRDIDDIIASQKRINWTSFNEPRELAMYFRKPDQGPISRVKIDFWITIQKPRIASPYTVEYESLSEHPMWVEKAQRTNFGPRQTTLE